MRAEELEHAALSRKWRHTQNLPKSIRCRISKQLEGSTCAAIFTSASPRAQSGPERSVGGRADGRMTEDWLNQETNPKEP